MKNAIVVLLLATFTSFSQQLTQNQANHLATLPLKCLNQEYPNKLSQMLIDSSEIQSPKNLHPAFYGCFDWHSSVHGHWSLVYLLNKFPDLENRVSIIERLQNNLSKENIDQEIAYVSKSHEKSFERTYGWTWLLKLQLELETSTDSYSKELAKNLKPLTNLFIERYTIFLPKLLYPIRVGTHTNTAFGLSFAYDYACYSKNTSFQKLIEDNAKRLYLKDQNCPLTWEPSGTDFLSPCFEELGLMQRVLPEKEFIKWTKNFAPQLFSEKFSWQVAQVSDRTDGHLVHLDGLNFSRAWTIYHLANQYPNYFTHLLPLANTHFNFSLPSVVDGNYEGEHWLASFALRAFQAKQEFL